jgi:hypothetical protein
LCLIHNQVSTPICKNLCLIPDYGKNRLRVFEKTVLRNIFGSKRKEVTWDWRNEIHILLGFYAA